MSAEFIKYKDISKLIDHSLLNPSLNERQLEDGIKLAVDYDVASVCIMPFYLKKCSMILRKTDVKSSTTIGFPHGGHTLETKLKEIEFALHDGAQELDMVINISKAISGDWAYLEKEIKEATKLIHAAGQKIKIIFENCYLNNDQKIQLCKICGLLNVDWVKTSTGYGSGGATEDDVILMRKYSPETVQIKAAGGIRNLDTLLRFRDLGVTRIGASRTSEILDEVRHRLGICGV